MIGHRDYHQLCNNAIINYAIMNYELCNYVTEQLWNYAIAAITTAIIVSLIRFL